MGLIQIAKSTVPGASHKGFVRLDGDGEHSFPNIQRRDHFLQHGDSAPDARGQVEYALALAIYHQDHHAYVYCLNCLNVTDLILHVHYVEGWCIDTVGEGIPSVGRIRYAVTDKPLLQDKAWKGMIWRALDYARKEYGGYSDVTPRSLQNEVVKYGQGYHYETSLMIGLIGGEDTSDGAGELDG